MLTITKPSHDRINVSFSGQIDADEMRQGLDAFIDLSEGIIHGKLFYTIPDFALPTLEALAVKMGLLPRLFSLVRRFDRAAILSDIAWLRAAAEFEGALVPGLEIRAFRLADTAIAEAWLEHDGDGDGLQENVPV